MHKAKKMKKCAFFFFLLFSHKWYILTRTGMFLSIKTMIDIPAVFICTCRLNAHMHKVKQLNTFFSFVKGNNIIILLNTKEVVHGFFFLSI